MCNVSTGNIGAGSVGEYTGILRNYKVPVLSGAGPEKIQARDFPAGTEKAPAAAAGPEVLSAVASEQKDVPRRDMPRRNVGPKDISLTFNRQESFGYIGRDSDIRSLDVEKAIDDMKKDKVLQQYQYFVGSSRNLYEAGNIDGMVVRKL